MKRLLALCLCLCLTLSLVSCDAIQRVAALFEEPVDVKGSWQFGLGNLPEATAESMYRTYLADIHDETNSLMDVMKRLDQPFSTRDYFDAIYGTMSLTFKDNGNYTVALNGKAFCKVMIDYNCAMYDAMANLTPHAFYNVMGVNLDVESLEEALAQADATWEEFRANAIKEMKRDVTSWFTPQEAAKDMGGKLSDDGNITLESGVYTVKGDTVTLVTVNEDGDTVTFAMTMKPGEDFFSNIALEGEQTDQVGHGLLRFYKVYGEYFRLTKARDEAAA